MFVALVFYGLKWCGLFGQNTFFGGKIGICLDKIIIFFDSKHLTREQMAALFEYYHACTEPRRREFMEMIFFAFHTCGLRVVDVMALQRPPHLRHNAADTGGRLLYRVQTFGHSDMRTTQIYASIINKKKEDVISLIDVEIANT